MSWCAEWLEALLEGPSESWTSNVKTRIVCPEWRLFPLPVSVNDTEWNSSYVCSPYNACISYAEEELHKLGSPKLEIALKILIRTLSGLLRWGQINRNLHVNNWLLSTNLYPDWQGQQLEELHAELRLHFPDHAILFRSLNRATNAGLMNRLQALGYRMIPSRQVYMFDYRDPNFRQTKNTRWDLRLLDKTPYTVVAHDQLELHEVNRIVELYNLLYLEKYSQHNPHFSPRLVALWLKHRHLRMFGLRHPSGRLDGIVGLLDRGPVTTVPLVGYATALPQELGLYRLLMAIAMRDCKERRVLLNLSAGAAHFKRVRGGRAYLEYSAVDYHHLAFRRRLVWRMLDGVLTRVGAPLMVRFKL